MLMLWMALAAFAAEFAPSSGQYSLSVYGPTALIPYPDSLYRIPGGDLWCPSEYGTPYCKPAIYCSVWFIDILRNPWWCWSLDGSWGMCCPDVYQSTSTVARFPHVSVSMALPRDVSPVEINTIISGGSGIIEQVSEVEWYLWKNISYNPNPSSVVYSLNTLALWGALKAGWNGLQQVEATRKIATAMNLSPKEAGFATQLIDISKTALADTCIPAPVCSASYLHRTYDGSCNNLKYPNWGRSNTALDRDLPPAYSDGIWAPKEWPYLAVSRDISRTVVTDENHPEYQLSHLLMVWGQFVAHDVVHTPVYRSLNNTALQCCTPDGKYLPPQFTHPLCFPVDIPVDDPFYSQYGVSCLDFVRSVVAPREECTFGYANQLNQNTHYLDGSPLYGSTEEVSRSLREYSGGRLKASYLNGQAFLPVDETGVDCPGYQAGNRCFLAGDVRVNQYPALTALHTLFLRKHNSLADQLAYINPHWDDERIYQEARKIVGAIIQHITYNEYLPAVLGPYLMAEYGLIPLTDGYSYTYDENVKGGVIIEFAAAAFRYGHSLIQNWQDLYAGDMCTNYAGQLFLKDWFNNPGIITQPYAIDALFRGLMCQNPQNFDPWVSEAVNHYLFKVPYQDWGLDLITFNIWRGRDYGITGYNHYREACGLKRAQVFDDLLDVLRPDVLLKLKKLYESVDDIDLYVGLLAEWPVNGGIVGPTAACIISDQFLRLKDGDRFYYEHGGQPHSFTSGQLREIRRYSLARLLCETAGTIQWATPFVLWAPSDANPWLPCYSRDIPHFDITLWKDV